jgi:predicted CopG family antitoxin
MEKSIKISDELHKELTNLGTKPETFADVIWRLIDYYKKGHPKK